MSLTGFVRPDGRVGFRNHLVIFPLVGCVSDIARRIADSVEGAMALIHPHGCEQIYSDADWLALQIERLVTHPNVGGVLFVTQACGGTNAYHFPAKATEAGKLAELINFSQVGGTLKSVAAGVALARKMLGTLRSQPRQEVAVPSIILGTKCGASDKTSLDVLNPILGRACDRLVDEGATVVLGENYELWGDIETLSRRGASDQVSEDILKIASNLEADLTKRFGKYDPPTEADRIESAKRAAKAGTRPIQRVVPLQGRVEGPGLVVHDGPNSDLISVTTFAVAGCNLLLFGTGRGTAVGGPCVPAVKVTANPRTQELMEENIDVGLGAVAEGRMSLDEAAELVYQAILRTADGEPTRNELLRHFEMQFHIQGVTY